MNPATQPPFALPLCNRAAAGTSDGTGTTTSNATEAASCTGLGYWQPTAQLNQAVREHSRCRFSSACCQGILTLQEHAQREAQHAKHGGSLAQRSTAALVTAKLVATADLCLLVLSATKHSTAQHSTAQHSLLQHSTAQTRRANLTCKPHKSKRCLPTTAQRSTPKEKRMGKRVRKSDHVCIHLIPLGLECTAQRSPYSSSTFTSALLVAASSSTPSRPSNPSSSVSSWFKVWSRSSLTPIPLLLPASRRTARLKQEDCKGALGVYHKQLPPPPAPAPRPPPPPHPPEFARPHHPVPQASGCMCTKKQQLISKWYIPSSIKLLDTTT